MVQVNGAGRAMWGRQFVRITALIAALSAVGCGSAADGGDDPKQTARKPTEFENSAEVRDYAGGETGSFTPSPCGSVSTPVDIDADAATALGFPVSELTGRLERGADAPLRWTTKDGPWKISGYEPETRVRATMRVSKLGHYRPSEKWCDGVTCQRGESEPVEQASCTDDGLFYYLQTRLETEDGAIEYAATCLGAMWRNQLAEWPTGKENTGADCYTEIQGNLRISGVEQPYVTTLGTHFLFEPTYTSGSIEATISHIDEPTGDEASLSPVERLSEFSGRRSSPIEGRWPQP
jgi:hypothetical protein